VEVRTGEEVHVTAPAPKVYVNAPPAGVMPVQGQPVSAAAPQPAVPMGYAAPAAPAQAGVPLNVVATVVQTREHPRLALGLDWVPIPIPIPRLYSVPAEQTVTLTQPQFAVAPPPVPAVPVSCAPPVVMQAGPVYQMPPPCGAAAVGACAPAGGAGQAPPPTAPRDTQAMKDSLDSVEKKLRVVEQMLKERDAKQAPDP
jgi:hypothetical protein